jgi:hypothetical protein
MPQGVLHTQPHPCRVLHAVGIHADFIEYIAFRLPLISATAWALVVMPVWPFTVDAQ